MTLSAQKGLIRIGLLAKGVVYTLVGILAVLSVVGTGGQISGKKGIMNWIVRQDYGPHLVAFLAFGSFIYGLWMLVSAYKNAEHHKNKFTGPILRLGGALSGFLYVLFALYAGNIALGYFKPGMGSIAVATDRSTVVADLMDSYPGRLAILFLALVIGARGLYSAGTALSGRYAKKVKSSSFSPRVKRYVLRAGHIGYLGQAVSALIVAYMLTMAVIHHDPSTTGDEEQVFGFVEGQAGKVAVGLISFGLLCYGFFLLIQARYGKIKKVV